MFQLVLIVTVVAYAIGLLIAGWAADRDRRTRSHPLRYSLSLATLGSAWTYFGTIGQASSGSSLYLANALGAILAITVGYPVWRKIAVLAKQENVGSLADFLAARYGKNAHLGRLCAVIATIGALPFIALQLRTLGSAWAYIDPAVGGANFSGLLPLAVLVLVALAFGARRPSLTQHNRGFTRIISIESCVKLLGLLSVALLAASLVDWADVGKLLVTPGPVAQGRVSFPTLLVLCTITVITVPRQFHLAFVTLENVEDTRTARWVVPVYFALWILGTAVVATAIRADTGILALPVTVRVLALPLMHGADFIALLVALGGLSAGAAMIVVEMTATSAMVSNEILLPLLARSLQGRLQSANAGRWILLVRHLAIVLIGLAAWGYFLSVRDSAVPSELGLITLTAFAQFVPALIGGIYWRRGHAHGAIAGIAAGSLLWLGTIAGPHLLSSGSEAVVTARPIEMAIALSLIVNVLLYVVVSLLAPTRLVDSIQARTFVGDAQNVTLSDEAQIRARIGDVAPLLARFIGADEAAKAVLAIKSSGGNTRLGDDAPLTATHARMVEKLLAGVIGAPSARNLVTIAISSEGQSANEIDRILDEAAHAVHFSHDLLQTALHGLSNGVSVVDDDLRLIAWNRSYLSLLGLTASQVYIGKLLPELLAEQAASSGAGTVRSNLLGLNGSVARREELAEEWQIGDGRILLVTGKPIGDGDYLTSLSDITELKAAEAVLAQDKAVLERRVEERTSELTAANLALQQAKRAADRATAAERRFVAAASHDLVQPLHAARMFIAGALPALDEHHSASNLLRRADQAVDNAHSLMRALLSLSRLEIGAVAPNLMPVDLQTLFYALSDEFQMQAELKQLSLHMLPTRYVVQSDPDLLRSMLQNLVQNALRYTQQGRVVVAARRSGPNVRIEVRDSGVGIAQISIDDAFAEFNRLPQGDALAQGAGLGLAIVARIGQVLDHPVTVRSEPGVGSVFALVAPRATGAAQAAMREPGSFADLGAVSVLCVDDDEDVLLATRALIERWGGTVDAVTSAEHLHGLGGTWDVALVDHRLVGEDGLSLLRRLGDRAHTKVLLTATFEDGWETSLPLEGITLLRKPLDALSLWDVLAAARR